MSYVSLSLQYKWQEIKFNDSSLKQESVFTTAELRFFSLIPVPIRSYAETDKINTPRIPNPELRGNWCVVVADAFFWPPVLFRSPISITTLVREWRRNFLSKYKYFFGRISLVFNRFSSDFFFVFFVDPRWRTVR